MIKLNYRMNGKLAHETAFSNIQDAITRAEYVAKLEGVTTVLIEYRPNLVKVEAEPA